jgi:kynurenine formamidase
MMMLVLGVLLSLASLFSGSQAEIADLTHGFDEDTIYISMMKKFNLNMLFEGYWNNGGVMPNTTWLGYGEYSAGEHGGTHMDAPSHFVENGKNIGDLDVKNFIGPAVVIDISARAIGNNGNRDPDAHMTKKDILDYEAEFGRIQDGSILLLYSGWDRFWSDKEQYLNPDTDTNPALHNYHFPYMADDAVDWVIDNRKLSGIGLDTPCWDKPDSKTFSSHKKVLGSGIFGLENVNNLGKIPRSGATVYVFPMKITRGTGAPTRIIAQWGSMSGGAGRNHWTLALLISAVFTLSQLARY